MRGRDGRGGRPRAPPPAGGGTSSRRHWERRLCCQIPWREVQRARAAAGAQVNAIDLCCIGVGADVPRMAQCCAPPCNSAVREARAIGASLHGEHKRSKVLCGAACSSKVLGEKLTRRERLLGERVWHTALHWQVFGCTHASQNSLRSARWYTSSCSVEERSSLPPHIKESSWKGLTKCRAKY